MRAALSRVPAAHETPAAAGAVPVTHRTGGGAFRAGGPPTLGRAAKLAGTPSDGAAGETRKYPPFGAVPGTLGDRHISPAGMARELPVIT
jgi:hypothetical protein